MQHDLEHSHASAIRAHVAREANGSYLRDWTYGATNGSVTTFAIVTGVAGTDLPAMVTLVVGITNVFTTAARNYGCANSNRDNHDRVLATKRRQIFA